MAVQVANDLRAAGPDNQALTTYQSYVQKIIQQILAVKKNLEEERNELNEVSKTLQKELGDHLKASRENWKTLRLERDGLKKTIDGIKREESLKKEEGAAAEKGGEIAKESEIVTGEASKIEQLLLHVEKEEKKTIPYEKRIQKLLSGIEGLEKDEQKKVKDQIDLNIKGLEEINKIAAQLTAMEARAKTGFINIDELKLIRDRVTGLLAYTKEKERLTKEDLETTKQAKQVDVYIERVLKWTQGMHGHALRELKQAQKLAGAEKKEVKKEMGEVKEDIKEEKKGGWIKEGGKEIKKYKI